jgi:hypothetical protein
VSEGEKRDALEQVLRSQTFSRSTQLRALLRHLCETEMAGCGGELNEYKIAMEVLGRRKDVALTEDSTVRNRVYELRQRLEKLYSAECPDAAVRIDIPRGAYVPAYIRASETHVPIVAALKTLPSQRWMWLSAAAIAVICLTVGWAWGVHSARTRVPAIVVEAWGPLASPDSDLLICLATNLHLLIRPHLGPGGLTYAVPEELYPLFRQTRPLQDGEILRMTPALMSITLGETIATSTLTRTRTLIGGSYQVLPESEAPITVLLERNSILIGTPVQSRAASILLEKTPLTVGFTPNDDFRIVDRRKPAGQDTMFVTHAGSDSTTGTLYGLLTVKTRTDSGGKQRRIVSLAGTGSAGVLAAVNFISSPERLRELKARFRAEGQPGFPLNYQVVLRAQVNGVGLIAYEYAAHAVMSAVGDPSR